MRYSTEDEKGNGECQQAANMANKLYAYGMDGFIIPMERRFVAEGIVPNFERTLMEGTVNRLHPSFPV